MPKRMSRVSVIGLGKLGAPLAACFASKKFSVIGADVDKHRVRDINDGRAPFFEPGLQELLMVAGKRLTATEDTEAAVLASDVTFIVVPTPSEPHSGFSLRYVLPACEAVGRALLTKENFHLVVLTSTVMPGSTGGPIRSTLEKISDKRCGMDFGLCYSPEFIALGSVIRDFLNPDFLLIGESDQRSGEILERLYRDVCKNDVPIARMNFINAEVTKLAVNTFVTTKITFGNMLARICERLAEANVDVVTSALGLDSRIGSKYLKGAIGYGGPCFPRDNVALASLAHQIGSPAVLAEATDRANREEVPRLVALVKSKIPNGGTVGILGLAYKPNTDVVEESQGVLLARALATEGIAVIGYDPAANENARQVLDGGISFAESPEQCAEIADLIVITTPWDAFRRLEPAILKCRNVRRILIDCWRVLDREDVKRVVDYVALGVGPQTEKPSPSNDKEGKS